MPFICTTGVRKIAALRKRIRAIAGGTSASKTIGTLMCLIDMSQTDRTPKITSVVSESLPHLKRGAMRDFKAIMDEHGYWQDFRWNGTDHVYEFETGSRMEFFSANDSSKVRGPRRNRLFVNEANNISLDTFEQLEIRTSDLVYLDWNPISEFWFYTDMLPNNPDVEFIKLTYKDNEALAPSIVKSIESRRNRKGWWKVYGEGELGEVEGKIYKDWLIVTEIPHNAKLVRRGVDFGFSEDPAVGVNLYAYDGGYLIEELFYGKGMSNRQIADILNADGKCLTYCDSSEPKSIAELRSLGVMAMPASKGKGSVRSGIRFVQDQRICITDTSTNLIKEYRNYLWVTDNDGKITDEPEHEFSHGMDAVRYSFDDFWMSFRKNELEQKEDRSRRMVSYTRRNFRDRDDANCGNIYSS